MRARARKPSLLLIRGALDPCGERASRKAGKRIDTYDKAEQELG